MLVYFQWIRLCIWPQSGHGPQRVDPEQGVPHGEVGQGEGLDLNEGHQLPPATPAPTPGRQRVIQGRRHGQSSW